MAHHCGDAFFCVAMVGILSVFPKVSIQSIYRFVCTPYFGLRLIRLFCHVVFAS